MILVQAEVILFLILLNGQLVSLSILYPFGSIDSKRLVRNDDGSSPEIPILTTFPYFDKNYNSLFVNTNGAISFERRVSQYTPKPFPLGDNRVMIAPFWADVDIRRRGEVSYREILNPHSPYGEFSRAVSHIKTAFTNQEGFKPTWLFIATWDKVPFFNDLRSINKTHNITNTFQLVLVTNGRHSFVIFNYEEIQWTTGTASGGNASGLGGTEAECGFNAGDGENYFSITRSNHSSLIALSNNSNIQTPGVWVFRIDNAVIENGGCNTNGFLTFPSGNKDSMHGGVNIEVAGPCFNAKDRVVCKFDNEAATPGMVLKKDLGTNRVRCTVPMVNHTRRVTMKVSIDNGETFPFRGHFQFVSIDEKPSSPTAKIYLLSNKWQEDLDIKIGWHPAAFGNSSVKVKIQIARYILQNNAVKFHSFFDIKKQDNIRPSQFRIPPNEGKRISDSQGNGRFVSFIRLIKENLFKTMGSSNEWIWSDVITWDSKDFNYSKADKTNCKNWLNTQPDHKTYTEGSDLLACPPTYIKALRDIGRYQSHNRTSPIPNPEGNKCIRTIFPSNTSAGQECCYNDNGNLVLQPPNSGKLVRIHSKSGIPFISNYFHDVLPHQDCCRSYNVDPRMCLLFYKKRPPDNGEKYEPPRPAVTVGEPHMVTLDDVQYTFNGIGEYHLLKIQNNGFRLQGRMEQMRAVNKTQINATVYTAFAMTETDSDTIQINLNGRGFVEIFVNNENVEFGQENLFEFSNGFILKSSNTSSYSVVFNSGICVTVEGYPDLLQSLIIVPEKYKGRTSGLFGFWDDDKEKEFLLPNGTFLDAASSPETIHYEFGLKWATKKNESLFFYPNGKNHSSFYKPDFVPAFLDYQNLTFGDQSLESEARRICGENLQCLFDIKITGKTDIGVSSLKSLEEFKEIVEVTKRNDCIPIDPILKNGVTQRNDTQEGILVYYFGCTSNYVLNGPEVIRCQYGVWNGTKPRCLECVLKDPNIIAKIIEETSHEITHQFDCKDGFNKTGPSSLKCISGKWTRDQPKCIKQCVLKDPNIIAKIIEETSHEITYQFVCKDGFNKIGPSSLKCIKGKWTKDQPKCIKRVTDNQADEEMMSAFHIALISGCSVLFLVVMVIITRWLVKLRTSKRRSTIIEGSETKENPVERRVVQYTRNETDRQSILTVRLAGCRFVKKNTGSP